MGDRYSDIRRTLDFLRQMPDVSRGDHENLLAAIDALKSIPELVKAAVELRATWGSDHTRDGRAYDALMAFDAAIRPFTQAASGPDAS